MERCLSEDIKTFVRICASNEEVTKVNLFTEKGKEHRLKRHKTKTKAWETVRHYLHVNNKETQNKISLLRIHP